MDIMLLHQHPHLTFAGTGVVSLKVEVALQLCLSLCWRFTSTYGLATWAGMLELVWDPRCTSVEMWGACGGSENSSRSWSGAQLKEGSSPGSPRVLQHLIPPALPSAKLTLQSLPLTCKSIFMEEQTSYRGCKMMLEYFSLALSPLQLMTSHPDAHIHYPPHTLPPYGYALPAAQKDQGLLARRATEVAGLSASRWVHCLSSELIRCYHIFDQCPRC